MSDELPTAARVSDPGIRALYRLENRWQAWLDVEAALARAQAELGIIPHEAAEAIAAAARYELLDRARLDEGFARTGHTIVPLVWELSRVTGEKHGGWVHWGATTQNITQTGDLLVLRQAHGIFLNLIADALDAAASLAERGERARTATQHGHEESRRGLTQPLDMAQQLVDPHRHLVAKGRRYRVLAVRAPGHRHLGAALGEIGHRSQRLADQPEEDAVRLPQHQQVAGLRDVLRRRAPVHPAAMLLADDARQFPDQRYDGVAGAGQALVDARAIQEFQPRGAGDCFGGVRRDDADFGLRAGQRDLHIEPGLPAVLQPIQRADARIRDACGRRQLIAHRVSLPECFGGPIYRRSLGSASCRTPPAQVMTECKGTGLRHEP